MLLLPEGEFFFPPSFEQGAGQRSGPVILACLDLFPSHNESSHSREGLLVPSLLSPTLGLWLPFEAVTLLTHLSFRNVECLNLLLSSGADLRRRDKFGRYADMQG